MNLKSFIHAFAGIFDEFKNGRNFRFMTFSYIFVIIANIVLKISSIHWAIIMICCGGVLTLEIVNTAIETTVDMFTKEYNDLAKKAKDLAAGGVLLFSVFSAVVGLIIYIPYIIKFVKGF